MPDRTLQRDVERLEADCQRLVIENLLLREELAIFKAVNRYDLLRRFFTPTKGR